MAAITWTDVTDYAAELAVYTSVNGQNIILNVVNGSGLDASNFGGENAPKTKLARVLLAAHYATMTLQSAGGVTGPVTSRTEGGVSESYGNFTMTNTVALDATEYGQLFRLLCSGTEARAGILVP